MAETWRTQRCRVRIEDARDGGPDRWLAPGAGAIWEYVDRPEDAGVWLRPEAGRRAIDYQRGYAWRGRLAHIEPVDG